MQLLPIKAAAKRLGLCTITLRKRIRDNGWPVYDLGKKGLRVDLDEILTLTRIANKPKQRGPDRGEPQQRPAALRSSEGTG